MRNVPKMPMNNAQLMVLQLVKEEYNETDLSELRQLLLDFNHRKMQSQLDKTISEKGYAVKNFEQMLKGHARKTS